MSQGAREPGSGGARVPRCVVSILDQDGLAPVIDLVTVQAVVDAALADDGIERAALTVLLVDDAESARLHAEHFDNPESTDVMTFPDGSTDPESGLTLLGDLAVCVDVARRVAADRGRPIEEELVLYILHGLLHLLGYDDVDERDQAEMWAIQRRLLAGVGIVIEAEPGDGG